MRESNRGSFFFLFISRRDPYTSNVMNEIFAGVYFCGLAIFCVLRELIFLIRTGLVFLAWN